MKKYMKTIIIIGILIALGLSYYFYLSNKTQKQDSTDKVVTDTEMAALTTKNIVENYPESPKGVVELYARITKAYYQSGNTDEQIELLGKQARVLFDEELKATQTEEAFMMALKADVNEYRTLGRYISDYKVDSAANFKYKTLHGREYAIGTVLYYIREGSDLTNTYHSFKLRKDSAGRWKILYWELTGATIVNE